MTTRPRKSKPVEKSRGMLDLRNRLLTAVAIMAAAGILLWKPWAPSYEPPGKTVAAVSAPAAEPPSPPQKPALAQAAAPAPAAAPIYVTASTGALTPPLPPLPPTAPRMPAALQADFDAWLIEAYRVCWTPPGGAVPDGDPYYPRVRVALKSDGTLAGAPKLVNPPWDPAWKAHAEAAVKAVKACDPLKVPDKYQPYYSQWKSKTVFFAPTRS
jgi:colicin import membrane protein